MISYSLGILHHYFTWTCILGMVLTGGAAALGFRLCGKRKIQTSFRPGAATVLGSYLFLILWFLVLGRAENGGSQLSLRLFWSYRAIRNGSRYLLWLNLLNVLLFVPVGVLLPLAWPKAGPRRALAIGASCSLLAELLQLLTARGLFELDDLFHNIIGTAFGVGLYALLRLLWRRYRPKFGVHREKE